MLMPAKRMPSWLMPKLKLRTMHKGTSRRPNDSWTGCKHNSLLLSRGTEVLRSKDILHNTWPVCSARDSRGLRIALIRRQSSWQGQVVNVDAQSAARVQSKAQFVFATIYGRDTHSGRPGQSFPAGSLERGH